MATPEHGQSHEIKADHCHPWNERESDRKGKGEPFYQCGSGKVSSSIISPALKHASSPYPFN
eukprot:1114780-Ditylum_brightwellii.AAC.1